MRQEENPISVVGIACRFPRAKSVDAFWDLLVSGRDATSELPQERWPVADLLHEDRKTIGTLVSPRAGLLDNIKGFDARFFGITPREAEAMDPQQRIALEVAYEALEDAGVVTGPPQRIGVFVGAWSAEYSRRFHRNMPNETLQYWGTGNTLSVIANRISYAFNFRGTSMTVDTASSSSLLAIHIACRAIEAGDIDRAVVGGVNLLIDPITSVYFTKIGALSPDGLSKSFDADANGYVRAEGCGFVVLERAKEAHTRGQRIYAHVLGTGSNQDGRSPGLTVPNGEAQVELIRDTLTRANLNAEAISYVEAHASGTPVGDPIEMAAIGEAYAATRAEPLRIGSVKSNIGHLEAAAGIAGFIKTVLAVDQAELPPTLHFHSPNREIRLEHFDLRVQNTHTTWPKTDRRVAAINSFGLGGTNVHVILAAKAARHEAVVLEGVANRPLPLVLSARSDLSLKERARQMITFLEKETSGSMNDIAGTLAVQRSHYDHRLVAIGTTKREWLEKLAVFIEGGNSELFSHGTFTTEPGPGSSRPTVENSVVFVFPGQGSQWLGMGRQLLVSDIAFAEEVRRIDGEMRPFFQGSIEETLREGNEESLQRLDVVQPILFAVAAALSAVLRSRGVAPNHVLGHSQGEIAAAYVAGKISLSDACKIVCTRSALVETTRGSGQMAVIGLAANEVDSFVLEHGVSIAAYNSPRTTIISGAAGAIESAVLALHERNVFARVLRVGYASHSSAVAPLERALREKLAGVKAISKDSSIFVSTTCMDDESPTFDADYWWRNLREPVYLSPRVQMLASAGTTFVEVSPHPGLENAIAETIRIEKQGGRVISMLRRDCNESAEILRTIADLFVLGHAVQWNVGPFRSVSIPSYPWEHNEFWIPLQEGNPMLSALENRPPSVHPSIAPELSFVALIRSTPRNERISVTRSRVAEIVYRLAKLGRRKGDLETPLKTLGFDSILFRTLEGELEEELGLACSAALLMSYGTISAISDSLLELVFAGASYSMNPEEAPTLTSLEAMAALDAVLEGLE